MTSDTELINYDPLTIAAIDYRNKSKIGRLTNFILDWLPYIVGLVVVVQVLVPEILMFGTEKS